MKKQLSVQTAAKEMSTKRKFYNNFFKTLMISAVVVTSALAGFLIIYILIRGVPEISWKLISTSPSYIENRIGILPDILNTIYIIITTLVILVPLGVCAAIYLSEYAKNKMAVRIIEYTIETLSGIPSIIFGLVGMVFFCRILGLKTSLIAGSLTMVMMNLPVIIKTSREAIRAVPYSYREAAAGLGAGKWTTIFTIIIPSSIDGIITGCILSIGRILGESAALLFTAGFAHVANDFFSGIFKSGSTLTVALYVYAKEQGEFQVAFACAAILMILTFVINIGVNLLSRGLKGGKR